MDWKTVLAPLDGGSEDRTVLAAAEALAHPFQARVVAAYAPADAADLMPWMGEGFMGGVQVAALQSLKEAAAEGDVEARAEYEQSSCPRKSYLTLQSPVAAELIAEARLSDVVVFSSDAAAGRSPLSTGFQQVLMEERRPVLVARQPVTRNGAVAVAWDGGREAAAAVRDALPWLRQASAVSVITAARATPRPFDPAALLNYLKERGVTADLHRIDQTGEPAQLILSAVKALNANLLIAGAFGHPRFQQFIFGGTTRALMQLQSGPSLFLSH